MSRDEHLVWCKRRALEYLDRGDVKNAVTSMLSDLDKHPETKSTNPFLTLLGMRIAANSNVAEARYFIVGFR